MNENVPRLLDVASRREQTDFNLDLKLVPCSECKISFLGGLSAGVDLVVCDNVSKPILVPSSAPVSQDPDSLDQTTKSTQASSPRNENLQKKKKKLSFYQAYGEFSLQHLTVTVLIKNFPIVSPLINIYTALEPATRTYTRPEESRTYLNPYIWAQEG